MGKFIPVEPEKWADMVKAMAENARLKAEVERLEARIKYVDNLANRYALDDVRSQAQVERLTKAGDELHAFLINYIVESRISSAYLNKLDDEWNAAKEGKQS